MTIRHDLEGVRPDCLEGFFVGWPNPPSPELRMRMLEGSDLVAIAWDSDRLVGFANALTDGAMCAFIPLLEVLPEWQGKGIGSALVRDLVDRLSPIYAIDALCDDDVAPFYERLGFSRTGGVARRDRAALGGH